MNKVKVSIVLNCLIVLMVLFATIVMMTGFEFMAHETPMTATKLSVFQFFTVDSNILVGIGSLLLMIEEILSLKKKREVRKFYYVFKYVGVVSVLLTLILTACFLAPFSIFGFFAFYQNSNLFFHFLIPVVSVISFVFFDRCLLSFKDSFYSIIPMACYAIYYMGRVLPHVQNGKVSYTYDFYGFLRGGVYTIFYVVPIIFLLTYAIGFLVFLIHKKIK